MKTANSTCALLRTRGVHDRTRFRRARSRRLGADTGDADALRLSAYWTSYCLWPVCSSDGSEHQRFSEYTLTYANADGISYTGPGSEESLGCLQVSDSLFKERSSLPSITNLVPMKSSLQRM